MQKRLRKQVGARIRELRKRTPGLTQERLAGRVGFEQGYISRVERGGVNLELDTLERIAAALSLEPFQLLQPPGTFDLIGLEAFRKRLQQLMTSAAAVNDVVQRYTAASGQTQS